MYGRDDGLSGFSIYPREGYSQRAVPVELQQPQLFAHLDLNNSLNIMHATSLSLHEDAASKEKPEKTAERRRAKRERRRDREFAH